MTLGSISYISAAVLFGILTLLLLTSWRGRLQGGLLVAASVVTTVWAVSAAYESMTGVRGGYLYLILEVSRSAAWLLFMFRLLEPLKRTDLIHRGLFRYGQLISLGLAGLVLAVDLSPLDWTRELFSRFTGQASLLGHLALALMGLMLVEQIYRNTLPEQRWAINYLFLGLGGIFAYDFYLYANALLFSKIDMTLWQARGFVNAGCAPLVAIAAARNPVWSVGIFVSRQVVFHATTVLGAGLYLLLMASAGYYIREFGGDWGTIAQVAFLFLAVMLLLALLFSGYLRGRWMLFLSEHFFSNKFDYREVWNRFFYTLYGDMQGPAARERAIDALADMVDSRGGQLWLRARTGVYGCVTARHMAAPPDTEDPDNTLIVYLREQGDVVDLADCERTPEQCAGLRLPPWLEGSMEAWLVVPLHGHEGLYGFMVLAYARVPREISWEDRELLVTAGRQVATFLAFLETSESLVQAQQFEAFNRLSAYVVHDMKNVVAQLDLVVRNAQRHRDNPAFMDDAIHTVDNASRKMQRLLEQLRHARDSGGAVTRLDLREVLKKVVAQRGGQLPSPILAESVQVIVLAERDRLMSVLVHLIQNAQEATPADGNIWVRSSTAGRQVAIEIEDTGRGMDADFVRDRLFRPFDTTKGNAGMGIGAYESREFVQALGGRLEVDSVPGKGTTFTVHLPIDVQDARSHQTTGSMRAASAR